MSRSPVWHPFTQHGLGEPIPLVERAEGAVLHLADGRRMVDAIASWWVVTHGHGHPRIISAIQEQAARLDQVIVFREVNGQPLAARFDVNLVRAGKMIDPVLSPNDRIVLGVSGSSQAWQDLLQALPVFALFTRI